MRRTPFLLCLVAALALIASACGASSDGASVTAASNDRDATDSDAAAPAESDTAADETPDDSADDESPSLGEDETAMASDSPLGAFFADDGGFQAALNEYTTRVEEVIVRCMAEQGFEFAPSGNQANEVQERQNELTERAWTLEYGYGISTSFDTIAQQQASDPNGAIIFSLGPEEREIWFQTLLGPDYESFGGPGGDGPPLEEQGCIGQALIDTGGQGAIEGLETFGEAYDEGEEGLYDRNEMIVAVGDWTRCMSEAGFPELSELDDPENEIGDRLDVITAPLSEALDQLDPEEGQALIAGDTLELESLPGLDVEALRALQADELDVAIKDLDCYDTHVREIFEPLRDDFQRGLMEEFSTELDALKNIGS